MNAATSNTHRPGRALLATIAAITLAFVSLVAVPMAASAAPNTRIFVSDVQITPADQQATVGDTLTVSGAWDASDADPQPGDTFVIGLPPEFAFPQSIPFPLSGIDEDGNPVTWGNCLTDPTTGLANCELTDAVVANPELVSGTWQFDVEAATATTAETVPFNLNGTSVAVDLPGTGGIDDGIELPGEVTKAGTMNQNNWSMTWTVDIPGANMVGQNTVTMRDTLGTGHQICTPTGFRLETVRGSTVVDVSGLATVAPTPGATEFDVVLAAPPAGFDPAVTYRVTYQTCTPDGQIDAPGTGYNNTAQVQGWGDAGRGVGTVTSRPWQVDLTKSGSVLGGADRNNKVAWTVTVPGDQLVGKTAFTLSETLGPGHEVCADTVDGIQITERYGPSNQLQRNITSSLDATVLSTSASAFGVRFDINDTTQFRPSDYRYIVTYRTCVTATDLPNGNTAYSNDVAVDGQTASSAARVPARAQGKSGRINSATTVLDGVPHMPQTTISWTVTLPGELIEDEAVLTLTDTLSASQQVCEAGDPTSGIAAQLGLRVEARDQIQNGGLAPVDLTGATTATTDSQQITLDIEAVDLPTPGGTSDGFSREYQYVITYTTCTTSGGMDAPGTTYSNEIAGAGIRFATSTTQNNRGSGTGQGVTRGSVAIDKTLTDTTAAAVVPATTAFTVHVREIDPTGTLQNEYDLQIPLNGAPVSGLNARGTGWTLELTEPTFPAVPGVTFGTPVFAASADVDVSADGRTAIASVTPGRNISVSLANTALFGSASLVKEVTGGAVSLVDDDRTYTVKTQIDTSALGAGFPAQPDREVTLVAGEPVLVEDLPIGATVTFTETRPTDDDTLTWSEPTISPSSLVVSAATATDPALVTVTNRVERTVGTFSLTKNVTGAQAENPAVPATVTVNASWIEDGTLGSATLTLPTDGTPVPFGRSLLIGTEVTLEEVPLADGASIAWSAPVWSGAGVTVDGESAVVTIGRDPAAAVVVENHAATSTAGISIIKGIAGEAAGAVDSDTPFAVEATWTDADGTPQSRELTITADGPVALGEQLPAGTVVTLTEQDPPQVDTVTWGSIVISGTDVIDDGNGSARVTIPDQQGDVLLVTVINEATWTPGTFTITKSFDGIRPDDADIPSDITVTASWDEAGTPQSVEMTVPTDGTPVTYPDTLAFGTQVTLRETPLPDATRFTWAHPSWDGERVSTTDQGDATVTIGADDNASVALTNTAVESRGSLIIAKSVTGTGADDVAATPFPLVVSWIDLLGEPQARDVVVIPGDTVEVEDIPLGIAVRIEEKTATLADDLRWSGARWSTTSSDITVDTAEGSPIATVVLSGDTESLELENTVEKISGLATTGGAVSLLAAGLAASAIIFGLLLVRRRRRA